MNLSFTGKIATRFINNRPSFSVGNGIGGGGFNAKGRVVFLTTRMITDIEKWGKFPSVDNSNISSTIDCKKQQELGELLKEDNSLITDALNVISEKFEKMDPKAFNNDKFSQYQDLLSVFDKYETGSKRYINLLLDKLVDINENSLFSYDDLDGPYFDD